MSWGWGVGTSLRSQDWDTVRTWWAGQVLSNVCSQMLGFLKPFSRHHLNEEEPLLPSEEDRGPGQAPCPGHTASEWGGPNLNPGLSYRSKTGAWT